MAKLLFKLHGVPEDEADEVRAILEQHGIEFYETEAGRWGLGVAALWLPEEERLPEARALIDTYQADRALRSRAAYEALRAEGRADTLLHRILRRPLLALGYFALILLILYFTIAPFVHLI